MVAVCPVLVGRDEQLGVVDAMARAAASGRGSACVIVGEPGIGKTRLAAEVCRAAGQRGAVVITGRCVPASVPTPFRPIAEALSSVTRQHGAPEVENLTPFRKALGLLVPDWRAAPDEGEPESLLTVAEGSLRLLRWLGRARGCVVVLEDLHWSDPETRAVFEYLADNISGEPVLLLATARHDHGNPMLELATRLQSRRAAEVIELAPLSTAEVEAMVAECQPEASIGRSALAALIERSDGVPLLVEELLAAVAASGVRLDEGSDAGVFSAVPATFAQSVSDRLAGLDSEAVRLLHAAAVIGETFDIRVLASITDADPDAVTRILRPAEANHLLGPGAPVGSATMRFRHSLTRQAILDRVVSVDRARWARRAAPEVEDYADRGDASWRNAPIELWIECGNTIRAAELLLDLASEALHRGALSSAEAALERAGGLCPDGELTAHRLSLATEVLALSGRTEEAARAGEELLAILDARDAPAIEVGAVHLRMARVCLTEGRSEDARAHISDARTLVPESERGHHCRCDALEAHACLNRERIDEALVLAGRAAEVAEELGLADAACEALQALGRASQVLDVSAALAAHERAIAIATGHGLAHWRARALRERGWLEVLTTGRLEPLYAARESAIEIGAVATAADIDTSLAFVLLNAFRRDDALAAAARAAESGRRYHLAMLSLSRLAIADAHAWSGRRTEMETAIGDALASPSVDPSVEAGVWGDARALLSLFEDNLDRAIVELDRAMAVPLTHLSRNAPYPGLWALVRTVAAVDGDAARARLEAEGVTVGWMARAFVAYANAVAAGRLGRPDEASQFAAVGDSIVDAQLDGQWLAHLAHRLIAPAALAGHWGQPVEWLRRALDFFDEQRLPGIASACRKLLRDAGVPVPRRGRGDAAVPAGLRAIGVTTREMDVLLLVARGMSNVDIAARLHLSVRTVENHVSRLLMKTGAADRRELRRRLPARTDDRDPAATGDTT